jgi:hypothetical protein
VPKGIVFATPQYLNDFTTAAEYIASPLNVTLANQSNKQRNIEVSQSGDQKN